MSLSSFIWSVADLLRGDYKQSEYGKVSRIFKNADFGYRTITVERLLKDEQGNVVTVAKGRNKGELQPDSNLRDTENVPLNEEVEKYFKSEVLPHVPDAWIDHDKTKVGYEIPFNRHLDRKSTRLNSSHANSS